MFSVSLFETRTERANTPPPKRKVKSVGTSIEVLHKQECRACPFDKADLTSPKMLPTGAGEPDVYILGEAPGETEDRTGEQFVGKSGQLLRSTLSRYGLLDHARFNNTVRCRPPKNRKPEIVETECCRPRQVQDIEQSRPKIVLGVGGAALEWLLGPGKHSILLYRGRKMPMKLGDHFFWFYPILHPSFVQRTSHGHGDNRTDYSDTFDRDIRRVAEDLAVGLESAEDWWNLSDTLDEGTTLVTGAEPDALERVVEGLKVLASEEVIGVDIETSDLRPYSGGKILSIAFAGSYRSLVIALDHPDAQWSEADREMVDIVLKYFLSDPSSPLKVAHNLAFELEWLSQFYGTELLRGSKWADTMAEAYCLDERRGGLGLDFLFRLRFGRALKALDADKSKLSEVPLGDLLPYNARDARGCLFLHQVQCQEIAELGLNSALRVQIDRIPTLVLAQRKGLHVDSEAAVVMSGELEAESERIRQEISEIPAVKKFSREFDRVFAPTSQKDLKALFGEILNRQECHTKEGKFSTAESILKTIDLPIADLILRLRSLAKLNGTYVKNLLTEGDSVHGDGLVHTSFNSTFTATGRLSSSNPNVQNFPKRKNVEVRRLIVPPPGHVFVAIDYGQIEARVIGMYSKDDFLCSSIIDGYDIHQAWAERIAEMFPSVLKRAGDMKSLRSETKNTLVFPAFYGAQVSSIARSLDVSSRRCEELFKEFWAMFEGVRAWQGEMFEAYKSTGFVSCLTGRRRHEPLTSNMVLNSPIQGTASDIVVGAMNRLSGIAQEQDLPHLQAVLNVHDDLSFCIPEDLLEDSLALIVAEMTEITHEWMNVPLAVEVSVGENWCDLEEIGTFQSDWDKSVEDID